jgi:undecaprenyl-diphosphatase
MLLSRNMKISKNILWINFISIVVFIVLMVSFKNSFFSRIDSSVNFFMTQIQGNFFVGFSKVIAFVFDEVSLIIISLIIALYLWIKVSKKDAVFLGFTMILGGAAIYTLKELVQRARPLNEVVSETGFAFPSGHATIAVIFFGLLIYLAFKEKSKMKTVISLISAFMIVLISFTRLYLNVHWFTDVLAGLALGTFILTGSIILRERIR